MKGTAMTTTQTPNPLRELWVPQLLMGLVALVVGVLVLMWPGVSILAASVLLGIYLVASGIAQVIMAFGLEVSGGYRVLLFITGAVSLVLGVLAFRHFGQGYAVLLLAIWIGVGFIFQGVAATALAISNKELPGRGWSIFWGVLSVIAGIVVLAWPFDSLAVLALVTGIMLVLLGITQVLSSFGTRNDLRTAEKRVSRVIPGAPTQAA
jgi:uncharacterized membrane protein HdeD (DUF308 family)